MKRSLHESLPINPNHTELLNASSRAPSAHNIQYWRFKQGEDDNIYEIHARQGGSIPRDPHSKDALLSTGAMVETMVLEAPNYGYTAEVTPVLTDSQHGLFVASVRLDALQEGSDIDPLSQWISQRYTNRQPYNTNVPLPEEVTRELEVLGNTMVSPKDAGNIALEAGIRTWADPQYITELEEWFRTNPDAPDGITPPPFELGKADIAAVKLAFKMGRVRPRWLGKFYASGDADLISSSPNAAVLAAEDMSRPALFDAGRRLLRSWTTLTGAGFDSQPASATIDDEAAAAEIAELTGVEYPVAFYRIGKAKKPASGRSNRLPLADLIIHD